MPRMQRIKAEGSAAPKNARKRVRRKTHFLFVGKNAFFCLANRSIQIHRSNILTKSRIFPTHRNEGFKKHIPRKKQLSFRLKPRFSPNDPTSPESYAGKSGGFPRKVRTFSGKTLHVFPQKRRCPPPSTSLLKGSGVCFL